MAAHNRIGRRRSSLECLENRQLCAGDVTATLWNGNLYLTEAPSAVGTDQKVSLTQLANGQVRVEQIGSGGPINGAAFQDFTVPGNLHINFAGGNDLVRFSEASPPQFNHLSINVGVPSAATGTDDDNVILWSVKSRGSVSIDTGADDDWVFIAKAKIGDGVGVDNLFVNMGAGNDVTTVKNSPGATDFNGSVNIQTYALESEADDDNVFLDQVKIKNDLNIRTGAGNDLVSIKSSTVFDDVDLATGQGNDTVELYSLVAVDSLMARLGEGNDSMQMDYVWSNNALLMGEAGTDSLRRRTGNIINLDQSGFEWINGRPTIFDDILSPVTPVLSKRLSR